MIEPISNSMEERLRETARSLPYPVTPNIAAAVRQRLDHRKTPRPYFSRRLAWALAVLLLLGAGLLLPPSVRAAVLDFISIGVIRIFQVAPTPTDILPSSTPGRALPGSSPSTSPDPTSTRIDLTSVLSLRGKTSLEAAQQQVDFPIRLPSEPPGLGEPDSVFLQDMDGPMLVLVWVAPGQPEQVELSLHMFGSDSFAGEKVTPRVLQETEVNGQPAVWTEGPYLLRLIHDDLELSRLIDGNVLIWAEDEITYRLESRLTLEEALRIAESLR